MLHKLNDASYADVLTFYVSPQYINDFEQTNWPLGHVHPHRTSRLVGAGAERGRADRAHARVSCPSVRFPRKDGPPGLARARCGADWVAPSAGWPSLVVAWFSLVQHVQLVPATVPASRPIANLRTCVGSGVIEISY